MSDRKLISESAPVLSARQTPQSVAAAVREQLQSTRPSNFTESKADILYVAAYNKGTAFSHEERIKHGLRGLLPPRIETLEAQAQRVMQQLSTQEKPLEKYIFLQLLMGRNTTLFYKVLMDNLDELMPVVYTPTVGLACEKFDHIFRVSVGMYFNGGSDRGHYRRMLDNWPADDVNIIVVTDGSRILGLGDLGTNGMGIPIGKLSLYVAGSGFNPSGTLPVMLDLGTNNATLLEDPDYLGERHRRYEGKNYYDAIEEFMAAVYDKWPNVLVQFEDFSTDHAFVLLDEYRNRYRCFNDDIQGTGAVILAGFINSLKVQGSSLEDARIVFYGAGSAGVGVADTIVSLYEQEGFDPEEARKHFWFVDSRGLITSDRGDKLADHKVAYARRDNDGKQLKDLLEIVQYVKANVLIGLAGQGPAFGEDVIGEMKKNTEKPIIFALSNPTSKAECTAEQAYKWTDGTAIFASGSPFAPVELNGKTYYPGQGNNMYIFPGLGFGAWLGKCSKVTDGMVVAAAKALAAEVPESLLQSGRVYPRLQKIRDISAAIAATVIRQAQKEGVCGLSKLPEELKSWCKSQQWQPRYQRDD